MKYLIVERMKGEGCDYTIGCGMRFYTVEAESIESAELKAVYPDGEVCSSLEGEMALAEILIVPFDQVHSVDVEKWSAIISEHKKTDAENEIRDAELRELERLSRKYRR